MTRFHDIMTAYKATRAYVHETPVITSNTLSQSTGHEEIVLKCENLQRTGSYRLRGAMFLVIQEKQRDLGVNHFVTHSTGNHGMAVALAAKSFDGQAHIVLPEKTNNMFLKSIKHYDGEVIFCPPDRKSRLENVQSVLDRNSNTDERGVQNTCVFIHPQADWLIAGNGTAGIELMEQTDGRLDAVLVPAAGGTLLAGVAIAVKGMKPHVAVFAAECECKDPNYDFEYGYAGSEHARDNTDPKAQRTTRNITREMITPLSPRAARYINRHVDGVVRVTEDQRRYAFRFIYERCKLVIDAESATAVAALLARPPQLERYRRVGIVLTGGNVVMEEVPRLARI